MIDTVILAQQWEQWMRGLGYSPRTITARVELLSLFETVTGVAAAAAGWQLLSEFLGAARYKPGTRQTYHTNLRSWYKWLVLMDHRLDDPMMKLRTPRTPRRRPRPISITQLSRMLEANMRPATRAMILLGAYEGLRVSEIAQVRGEHLSDGTIYVLGKGNVEATLPLHELIEELAKTMPARGFWFPAGGQAHPRPGPMTGKAVSAIISNVMRRVDIPPPYTPHSLRHFFGTESLKTAGGNLIIVKELMRHENVATTARYTEVEDSARRAAVAALPVPFGRELRAA